MITLTRRDIGGPLDILDWLEVPRTVLRPAAGHPVRMEDYFQGDSYVVRAELPGVNADSDLEVTASKAS